MIDHAHELINELNIFIVKSSGGKKNNKLLGYLNFLINELEKGYNRHSGIFKLNAITEMVDRKDEIVRELMKMNGLKESVRRFVDYVKKLWGEVKSWFKSDGGLKAILDQGKNFIVATKRDLANNSLGIFSKLARILSNARSFFNLPFFLTVGAVLGIISLVIGGIVTAAVFVGIIIALIGFLLVAGFLSLPSWLVVLLLLPWIWGSECEPGDEKSCNEKELDRLFNEKELDRLFKMAGVIR